MSKVGEELIQTAMEAQAMASGKTDPPRVYVPDTVDVAAIRKQSGLSQSAFAARYGLPVATVRDWEQGRRAPEGAARAYLTVIAREPEAVARALAS